jgi:hypothetical protein
MTTLVIQLVLAVLTLSFGALALASARIVAESRSAESAGWYVAAVVFLLQGISLTIQSTFAVLAVQAGPTSALYADYLRWAPAFNHSRGLLTHCLLIGFVAVLLRGSDALRWKGAFLTLTGLTIAIGMTLGLVEGSYTQAIHYTRIALSETVGLVALAVILFVAIFRPAMDRLLWYSMVLTAVSAAFTSLYIAALAWVQVSGTWTPSPWQLQSFKVALYTAMVGLGVWRLRLARQRIPVPGMVERKESRLVALE